MQDDWNKKGHTKAPRGEMNESSKHFKIPLPTYLHICMNMQTASGA